VKKRKKERINQMSEYTHREKATVGEGDGEEEKEKQDFLRRRVASSRGPGRA
jgi:hypothetical protein